MSRIDLSSLTHGEAFMMGMVEALLRRVDKLEAQVTDLTRAVEVLHWGVLIDDRPATRVECRKKKVTTAPKRKRK